MSTLVRRPKFGVENSSGNVPNISSWVDNFFNDSLGTGFLSNFNNGMSLPAVNIKEDEDNFKLEIAVPGMDKNDFNIDIDNKILSISSEKIMDDKESNDNYTRREFGYSSFKRTFTLPDSVDSDKIKATYSKGILSIELPKKEEAKQKPARQIKIS